MHLETPHSLKYNVTPISEGVLLSIWEPAPVNERRIRPFLFMVKHRLPSESEAQEVLGYYLEAYKPEA